MEHIIHIFNHIRLHLLSNYKVYIVYICTSTVFLTMMSLIVYWQDIVQLNNILIILYASIVPAIVIFIMISKIPLQMQIVLGKRSFLPILLPIVLILTFCLVLYNFFSQNEPQFETLIEFDLVAFSLPAILIMLNIYVSRFYPIQTMSNRSKVKLLFVIIGLFVLYLGMNQVSIKVYDSNINLASDIDTGLSLLFFVLLPTLTFTIGYKKANV